MNALTRFISTYFPPPRALAMPHIGIDLSDRSVKFAYIARKGMHAELAKYGSLPIPAGLVKSGVITNPSEVGAICKQLVANIATPFVAMSLPEEKAYVFSTHVSDISRDELPGAVELSLESHVPIAPEHAVFDIDIIKESKTGFDVSVSVFPKDVLKSYIECAAAFGAIPIRFEIEAQSLARALVSEKDAGTTMIVDIGRSRTGFAIVSGGILQHSATVPVGGDTLTLALSNKLGISEDIARKTKEDRGLLRTKENEEVCAILSGVASALRDEIGKHFEFWSKHVSEGEIGQTKIERVYLVGGDSNIPGMREYLRMGLPVSVEYGNPWANILSPKSHIPTLPFNESLQYASAIGLALATLE